MALSASRRRADRDAPARDAERKPATSPTPEQARMLALQAGAGNAAVARLMTAPRVSRLGIGELLEAGKDAARAAGELLQSMLPVELSASVGRAGENHPDDLAAVRRRLVLLGYPPADSADPTEALGDAIERFQIERVKLPRADGRVDPGGRTLKALNLGQGARDKPSGASGGRPSAAADMDDEEVSENREEATAQASLTADERERVAPAMQARVDLKAEEGKLAALKSARKQMPAADYKAAKAELQKGIAELKTASKTELKGVDELTRARMEMEEELVEVFPEHAAEPARAVAKWFADIQPDATFLGVPIRGQKGSKSPGIHKELAEKLAKAEALLDAHPQRSSIGVRDVGGLRTPAPATGGTRTSMHCYGLAVDIDPASNPFVRKGSAEPISRARLLISGKHYDVTDAPKADAGEQWDELEATSEDMRQYFALGAANGTDGIEARLKASPDARALGDAAWWQKRIRDDEAWLRANEGTWGRADPTKGLMTLNKAIVEALVTAGLRWGGQYDWGKKPGKGTGKDIMHFDWRGGSIKR